MDFGEVDTMKKLQRRVNVMVVALVMVFFVTACGAETAVSTTSALLPVNEPT